MKHSLTDIFEQEKAIYRAENVPLDDIKFRNNDLALALIKDRGGILDTLDEFAKPGPPRSWKDFKKKLLDDHCTSANWVADPTKELDLRTDRSQYLDKLVKQDRKNKTDLTNIIFHHYAGAVEYTIGSDGTPAFVCVCLCVRLAALSLQR